MRIPASLVAIPLFAGCFAGILLADTSDPSLPLSAAAAAALSLVAAIGFFLDEFAEGVALAVATGCVLAGVSSGLVATSNAYHPDLLTWFNGADADTRESPILIEGVLREDGALAASGASLVVDVTTILDRRTRARRRTTGGVRLTAGGLAAADLLNAWRAGAQSACRCCSAYRLFP